MTARYYPGPAAVLVGSQGLVATDRAHATVLVGLGRTEVTVLRVIDALSRGVLADLPDFACVVAEQDSLRVVVRGGFTVSAAGQVWSGTDAATWKEDAIPGATGAEVVVTACAPTDDLELPVEGGIVLASRLTWSAGDPVPRSATDATPEPIAEPATEPLAAGPDRDDPVEESVDDFDAMFGATVVGGRPADAAVRDTAVPAPLPAEPERKPEPEPEPADPASRPGDHDGRTITFEQFDALRAAELASAPRAFIVMPTGVRHDIAPRLLIGRRPLARGVSRADVPTLVTVVDPYVSATHLEVVLDGRRVLVTDMSSNGTVAIRPGSLPARLEKAVPTEVEDGTKLALSDDLTVTLEVEVPQ